MFVTGEAMQWHTTTLNFEGPMRDENPETFTDFRVDVTFTHADGTTIKVPGYFAADGDAANTSAMSGNIWQAKFTPPKTGEWTWTADFRTGEGIAISTDAGTSAGFFDGETGSLSIVATDKTGDDIRAKGTLEYNGDHYLNYAETGEVFLKAGSGSPENFLAYEGFDDTPTGRNLDAHLGDFNEGDPTWGDGAGEGLIGSINYLAEIGVNEHYFLPFTIGGDARDVSPYADVTLFDIGKQKPYQIGRTYPDYGDSLEVFDVSKLAQWDIAFAHMQEKGISIQMVFTEAETAGQFDGHTFGPNAQLYLREMIARFGHNNSVIWNIGEESTFAWADEMAAYIKQVDGYDHPVARHTYPRNNESGKMELEEHYGTGHIDVMSGQTVPYNDIFHDVPQYLEGSAEAGHPFVAFIDETRIHRNGVFEDDLSGFEENHDWLRDSLWDGYVLGASGASLYAGLNAPTSGPRNLYDDVNLLDYSRFEDGYRIFTAAKEFWEQLPIEQTREERSLVSGSEAAGRVIDGELYAYYQPDRGDMSLDLTGVDGTFRVSWYDANNGGDFQDGAVATVTGGGIVDLGAAPAAISDDRAVLVWNVEAYNFDGTPATLSLSLASTELSEDGAAAQATLTRDGATGTELVVTLTSDDTTAVTVPATVTIPAGASSVTFDVTPVNDPDVDGTQSATISATAAGMNGVNTTVNVFDNDIEPELTLTVTEALIEGGAPVLATLTRDGAAEDALVVTLASSDDTAATVPATVTIPAGASSVTFEVTPVDDTLVDGTQTATITAAAAGATGATVTVNVADDDTDDAAGPAAPISFEIEAEDADTLDGYFVKSNANASGGEMLNAFGATSTATYVFPEVTGTYDIALTYFDENDGASTYTVAVDGVTIATIVADTDAGGALATTDTLVTTVIPNVALSAGATITITGVRDDKEPARIDKLGFTTVVNEGPDETAPTVVNTVADDVTLEGQATATVTMTVADNVALDTASFDIGDISVTGPAGALTVTGVSLNVESAGSPRTVTYTVAAADGTFDIADNGSYQIAVNAGEILDTSGNAVVADMVGEIEVAVTSAPPSPTSFEIEAEAADTLDGYVVRSNTNASGGEMLNAFGTASTAVYTFAAAAGTYDIAFTYFDENDGASTYTVLVDGVEVGTFVADQDPGGALATADTLATTVLSDVVLSVGSEITVIAEKEGKEPARLDKLGFTRVDDDGPDNAAPTAVTLTTVTPTLAEDADTTIAIKIADIAITDDGLGTNVLSLAGADADDFEIVGTELFLKAGTALDFETQTSLDVTVQVDDASVGTAVDAAANFTLAVTDVDDNPPVNAAPTAVTLTPVTPTLAEDADTTTAIKVADIAITDDGLGTNVLSLAGADAASFEIVGSELFLKAGTALDFETQTSLDVTVQVDDASIGAAVDAAANFTLAVTDVDDDPRDDVLLRINAFGDEIVVNDGGPNWQADTQSAVSPYFDGTQNRGDVDATPATPGLAGVPDELFATARSDNSVFSYDIPLSDLPGVSVGDTVTVNLYFAEASSGYTRIFDVEIENTLAIDDLEPLTFFAADGGGVISTVVEVVGDELSIDFINNNLDNAIINGIEILQGGENPINEGDSDGGDPDDPITAEDIFGENDGFVQGLAVDNVNNGGENGSVVLTIMDGDDTVDSSNYGANSFQLTNTGDKEVAAVFLDIRSAVFADQVFDTDGTGGDTASKRFGINTDDGTGAYFVGSGGITGDKNDNLFFEGETPGADFSGLSANGGTAPISGGFRGLLIRFDGDVDGGFGGGETVGFSGDGDSNSLAGFESGLLNPNNVTSSTFDTGGQSGSELVGSSFTVLFADGTTATGYIGSDTTQAGAVGEAVQGRDAVETTLSVDTGAGVFAAGEVGTYGGDVPVITVTGTPGDTVRVTLHKGFQPTNEEAGPLVADVIQGRLDVLNPDFAVNNAFDVQTADVIIGDDGTATVASNAFDYVGTNSGETFDGVDIQQLALTATVVVPVSDADVIVGTGDNDLVPAGPITAPVYLSNPTGTPVDDSNVGGNNNTNGYFEIVQNGGASYFKMQIEDGSGGTTPGGKWSYETAPDEAGRQAGFEGEGYYAFGSNTSTSIDRDVGGNEMLEYTIYISEDAVGTYRFNVRASRDGLEADDQQNDFWVNIKHASDDGTGNIEEFLANPGNNELEQDTQGFAKLFGGPNNGTWGDAGNFDGEPRNFAADVAFAEAGFYTIQLDGRSEGYHVDYFELFTSGANPADGSEDSPFVEFEFEGGVDNPDNIPVGNPDTTGDNLISNGNFNTGDFTAWTVGNPTGGAAPAVKIGEVHFNSSNESVYGDYIEQDFTAETGFVHTVAVRIDQLGGGSNGNHEILIEVFDASDDVLGTYTHVAADNSDEVVTFDFDATSSDLHLRITNTTSNNSRSTDVAVDDVSVVATDERFGDVVEPGVNLIVNGDFENHGALRGSEAQGWNHFDEIEGWEATTDKIELQSGSFDSTNVAGNAVVELDAKNNAVIEQFVDIAADDTFIFSIDHATRGGAAAGSTAFEVHVNDVVVASVLNDNADFETFQFALDLSAGTNKIELVGAGASDGRGALVDNVALFVEDDALIF